MLRLAREGGASVQKGGTELFGVEDAEK